MARNEENLQWTDIDAETLPQNLAKVYETYRKLAKDASAARNDFDAMLGHVIDVPAGKRLIVSHTFGRLSIAFGAPKTAAKSAKAVSLTTLARK